MMNVRYALCVLSIISTTVIASHASAQENIELSGRLIFDKRFLIEQDNVPQYPTYHLAFLQLKAYPVDDVEAVLSTQLRYYDFSAVSDASGLNDSSQSSPWDILLWEVYVDIYGLGFDWFDLRIGKQRIAWGTADRLNPTDNLNPNDFTDYMNFGEKVPSWALKADFSIIEERLKLTTIFLPNVVPVLLPRYGAFPFGDSTDLQGLPPNIIIGGTSTSISTPAYDMNHTMQAAKLAGSLFSVDWSLSYFHGYDNLPLVKTVNIVPTSPTEVSVQTSLALPELHVVGADLAGELLSIGWWAEVAAFIPAKAVHTSITAPDQTGQPTTTEEVALSNDPYVKYTLGLDYTFSFGTYVNLQYNHGFSTERGHEKLHDYFMLRLEHKLLNGDLKLAIGALYETEQFKDPGDNIGLGVFPEVSWKPRDNLEFVLGYFLIEGKGRSLFTNITKEDQVYVKTKVVF
jgi:hypothetical protein